MKPTLSALLVALCFSCVSVAKEAKTEANKKQRKPDSVFTIEGIQAKKIFKLLQPTTSDNSGCDMATCYSEGFIRCKVAIDGNNYSCEVYPRE